MSTLHDDVVRSRVRAEHQVWAGRIASAPADQSVKVQVVIPGLSPELRIGPCRWMPRGSVITMPARGDDCLVVFDNNGEPWVICWWPF